jgi:hypothetical protein
MKATKAAWSSFASVAIGGRLVDVKRHRGRVSLGARRRIEPAPTDETPATGARSPGVRQRRTWMPRELDVSERIRRSLEARRGLSSGPTVWRS